MKSSGEIWSERKGMLSLEDEEGFSCLEFEAAMSEEETLTLNLLPSCGVYSLLFLSLNMNLHLH